MNIKKRIKSSWNEHHLPDTCLKKDEMTFKEKRPFRISVPVYIASMASLILIFSLLLIFNREINVISQPSYTNNFSEKQNKPNNNTLSIDFGVLNPNELTIDYMITSKIEYGHQNYFSIRNEFGTWFNSLNLKRALVDYNRINLEEYIANVNPVQICLVNDIYNLYFTNEDYLIVCYKNYYIIYDLLNADLLLESFLNNY